jgi:hypothetical protein
MIKVELYGRLGNKILQIVKALYYNETEGLKDAVDVSKLKDREPLLHGLPDVFFPENKKDKAIHDTFWNVDTEKDMDKTMFIVDNYILPHISFAYKKPTPIIFDNTLVMHIRSGDIFIEGGYPPGYYRQPPACFYENIINQDLYKRYLILSEDEGNPVIKYLMGKYPRIEYYSSTPVNDFRILSCAKYVAISCSTFSYASILLNKNLITYYSGGWVAPIKKGLVYTDFKPYYDTEVKTHADIRHLMLTYKQ